MRLYSEGQVLTDGKKILVCVKTGEIAILKVLEGDKLGKDEIKVTNDTLAKGYKETDYSVTVDPIASDAFWNEIKKPKIEAAKKAAKK